MVKNSLVELFRQRNYWKRKKEKEIKEVWWRFCWVLFTFSFSNIFYLVKMIIRGEKDNGQYSFFLSLFCVGLCALIIVFSILLKIIFSSYHQKINKIDQQIIKELEKISADSKE
ncbi:MAG: hypothetical protein I3273_07790 [Candidatus Moeniiplasma glomeromycotorum]|nr:hypothetical protein [Candidatus Moeniiplasma glomeromycotorum]MCE8167784.1 hypothetical protein [Candidatus Moeniiplasma glomeromycotorum]MCE8169981.1 hypothetical protein [Candidatus Moeniiplasma glomeromycotorum]